MTFLELQQEVVDRLNLDADLSNGDTPTPFTQADIQSFINKGYNDFLYLTKIYQKTTTVSASSSNYYELDKTYNRILSIMYNQKTLEIQETGAMGDKLGRADWRDYETDDEDPKYAIWENMST